MAQNSPFFSPPEFLARIIPKFSDASFAGPVWELSIPPNRTAENEIRREKREPYRRDISHKTAFLGTIDERYCFVVLNKPRSYIAVIENPIVPVKGPEERYAQLGIFTVLYDIGLSFCRFNGRIRLQKLRELPTSCDCFMWPSSGDRPMTPPPLCPTLWGRPILSLFSSDLWMSLDDFWWT